MTLSHDEPSRWFPPDAHLPGAAAQLFCLPHAGGGASAYRGWQERVGPRVEVVPVQLPGREARFTEPPLTSATELAGPLRQRAHLPFALFGHSMGALLAYELAHAVTLRGTPPAHLIVSGHRAPHLPRHPSACEQGLTDAQLVARLRALGGTAPGVLDHPELVELLLPAVRADYALCDGYRYTPRPPLPTDVTVLNGRQDPGVDEAGARAWRDLVSGSHHAQWFDGDHFYLRRHLDAVTALARDRTLARVPLIPAPNEPFTQRG